MRRYSTRYSTKTPIATRFWKRVDASGECWLWTGQRSRGKYGMLSGVRVGDRYTTAYAHRIAYELTHGVIPDGLVVCHRCDTPLCVRPDHLFLGTQADNLNDARRKGRMAWQK